MSETLKTPVEDKPSVLELLLNSDASNVVKSLPTARYRLKRLSGLCGADVVFTLRALPYGKVQQVKFTIKEEQDVQIVLAGVVEPDLRDKALSEKFGGATPADTVKAMLLPGEIEDLSRAIERLSGYRGETIEEIKNA